MIPSALTEQLRTASRAAHMALETLPFATSLAAGDLPLESYIGYLRAMAVVHSVMEHELPVEADARIDAVWRDRMRRLPALQQDLNHFAKQAVPDIPAAHKAAEVLANHLLRRSIELPLSMLGYLYVLEGSILGAKVLAPQVKKTFDLSDNRGLEYLQHEADSRNERWQDFRGRLDGLDLSEAERTAIVGAAAEAFDGIRDLISALHPFDPNDLVIKVTALNPEAGTHPVPQDPAEIQAVRHAADRCLQEYPYFVWRYGERGRRFAESDGAWLVTLTHYPQARIDRQIAWLGKVLATRGMPRVLLQRHLELLYEALRLHITNPKPEYTKLLIAAEGLSRERRRWLSDMDFDALAAKFDGDVGPDWRQRLPGSASILIGAVIDERAGLADTLNSVRSWYEDPQRCTPELTTAVENLVREVQRKMSPSTRIVE